MQKCKNLWKAVENHNNKRNKKDIYNCKKKKKIFITIFKQQFY